MSDIEFAEQVVREWEARLRTSNLLAEAERLRDGVVSSATATADSVWRVMWDKPLYANTRVAVAERSIEALQPEMGRAWRTIGLDPKVLVLQIEGRSERRVLFSAQGRLREIARNRPMIADRRLYAIQGAASVLRRWSEARPDVPASHLVVDQPLASLVPSLQAELGRGWGPITVLHLLTDLGLAVKPDLHLVRSLRALGLCPPGTRDVPTLRQAVEINGTVRRLSGLFGEGAGALRYTDKVLMEASRQKLLEQDRKAAA